LGEKRTLGHTAPDRRGTLTEEVRLSLGAV